MFSWLPAPVVGVLMGLLLVLNTLLFSALMVLPAMIKLLAPADALRVGCDKVLNALASQWVGVNGAWISAVAPRTWDVQGLTDLNRSGWYLVSPNHQSWVDILVLQRVFHQRIPFLKFFLKKELIWVPVIGLVWWALDFPFMARGKGQDSRQNDLATTRAACEKFKHIPTTVINFVEGTRFTQAKRTAQASPYRHLLKPKLGGLGVALATMGDNFEALLDVTIVYPKGVPNFWDLLCGRLGPVVVRVQQRHIPADLLSGDPVHDKALRERTSLWMEGQWQEKDRQIEECLKGRAP
jgi:1-acyl-sn-glycerol-3-phosphate acyltransferase